MLGEGTTAQAVVGCSARISAGSKAKETGDERKRLRASMHPYPFSDSSVYAQTAAFFLYAEHTHRLYLRFARVFQMTSTLVSTQPMLPVKPREHRFDTSWHWWIRSTVIRKAIHRTGHGRVLF